MLAKRKNLNFTFFHFQNLLLIGEELIYVGIVRDKRFSNINHLKRVVDGGNVTEDFIVRQRRAIKSI